MSSDGIVSSPAANSPNIDTLPNTKEHNHNLSIFSNLPPETIKRSLPPYPVDKDADHDPPYIDVRFIHQEASQSLGNF